MKYREKAPTKDINNPQTGNTPQNIVGRQNQRCPRRIQIFCGKKGRKYKEMLSTGTQSGSSSRHPLWVKN